MRVCVVWVLWWINLMSESRIYRREMWQQGGRLKLSTSVPRVSRYKRGSDYGRVPLRRLGHIQTLPHQFPFTFRQLCPYSYYNLVGELPTWNSLDQIVCWVSCSFLLENWFETIVFHHCEIWRPNQDKFIAIQKVNCATRVEPHIPTMTPLGIYRVLWFQSCWH